MRFNVKRTDDGNALIEMDARRLDDGTPFNFNFSVSDENAMMMRDAFNAAFPVESAGKRADDWKGDDEWVEVSLADAKAGDIAEFVCMYDEKLYCGRISIFGGADLIIEKTDFIGDVPQVASELGWWYVRKSDGTPVSGMRDLHIWRKLNPHRFDEPKDKGTYATQSGKLLMNEGDLPNWMNVSDQLWPNHDRFVSWNRVREFLDDSEFPLIRVTDESIRKAVES